MSQYINKAAEIGREAAAIGMKAGVNLVEKTKEINTQLSGGARFFDVVDEKTEEIKKFLDSSSDRQKLEGMKRLIAVIALFFTFFSISLIFILFFLLPFLLSSFFFLFLFSFFFFLFSFFFFFSSFLLFFYLYLKILTTA